MLQYVNMSSNHPQNITKNIPESINRRLNLLSKDENIFSQAIPPYQEALERAGYDHKLHYTAPKDQPQNRRRNKNRQMIWYNPPYCKSVKTNIDKEFFQILSKCFPKKHILAKNFNKNTIELSYSCMPSIGKQISGHNKKVLMGAEAAPPHVYVQESNVKLKAIVKKEGSFTNLK